MKSSAPAATERAVKAVTAVIGSFTVSPVRKSIALKRYWTKVFAEPRFPQSRWECFHQRWPRGQNPAASLLQDPGDLAH